MQHLTLGSFMGDLKINKNHWVMIADQWLKVWIAKQFLTSVKFPRILFALRWTLTRNWKKLSYIICHIYSFFFYVSHILEPRIKEVCLSCFSTNLFKLWIFFWKKLLLQFNNSSHSIFRRFYDVLAAKCHWLK